MGILDFIFGKKDTNSTAQKQHVEEDNQPQKIKYETKWIAQQLTKDRATIDTVAKKMIEEDPFKTEYNGKESTMDFKLVGERVYQYNEITTVNIDIRPEEGQHKLFIEGIELGMIPADKFQTIQPYFGKDVLTAYAYVTGGPYKEYSEKKDEVVSGEAPYGLDIYLQFT